MHKVIFDTDPGVDDALALLYLHRHPEIDLLAVTTVFGNAAVEDTTRNACFLKSAWGIAAPVAAGAAGPINPARVMEDWPAHIHGADGLGGIGLGADTKVEVDPRPAHRLIIDLVRAHPGEITLVAVARMTNLALALAEAPEIAGLVKQVVLMGGAFGTRGNVNPAAEANIWGDPEAADAVFAASWPVIAVGLDVTLKVVMTRGALDSMAQAGGPSVQLLRDLSQGYIEFYEGQVDDGMVVHDACACVYLTDRELFATIGARVQVITESNFAGMTIAIPEMMPITADGWDQIPVHLYCCAVEADAVLERIRTVVLGPAA